MSTEITAHQIFLRQYTLLTGRAQVKIYKTVFNIVNDTTLEYNGQSIPVNTRYFTPTTLAIEFLDVPALRTIVGPIHFIQLNKIYVFDIELDTVSTDHLYFTTDSKEQIFRNLKQFIELYHGEITCIDDDFIMVRCITKPLVIFTLHTMEPENGYVIELSSAMTYSPYQEQYTHYASLFDIAFGIKPIVDYKQIQSF